MLIPIFFFNDKNLEQSEERV